MPKKGERGRGTKPNKGRLAFNSSVYGSTVCDGNTIQRIPEARPPKSSWWAEAKDWDDFTRLARDREGHFKSTRSRDSIPRSDW